MSALEISITVNVILMIALLSLIFLPNIIRWYTEKKKQREKRYLQTIQKTVHEYLKQLQND